MPFGWHCPGELAPRFAERTTPDPCIRGIMQEFREFIHTPSTSWRGSLLRFFLQLNGQNEWIKIRVSIVVVFVLQFLKFSADIVSPRSQHYFHNTFDNPASNDCLKQDICWDHSGKCYAVEQHSVCKFPNDGRTNSSGPQIPPPRPYFHLCKNIIVQNATRPHSDPAPEQNSRNRTEDTYVSRVRIKPYCWGQNCRKLVNQAGKNRSSEDIPHDFSGLSIAVNLSQN